MVASTNTEKNDANEVQLLETVAARDPGWQRAVASLMNCYRPYLYHRCMHHLGNSADVEDVLQDVFINVYRFARRFERRAKLKTWLTRVADNQCYTFLRRQQQQQVNVEYSLAVIEIHETAMDIPAETTSLPPGLMTTSFSQAARRSMPEA